MLAVFASTLVYAAEVVEEEPSKTFFYIMGIALACWAVLLFAIGMRSTAFPGSAGAQRGVIAVSVLLVAATMTASIVTA
ncbi:MAG: hypothetical protein ACAH82_12330 [Solirubrobacteraceae bacterium]